MQINSYPLFLSRRPELPRSTLSGFLELNIETIMSIVGARSGLKLILYDLPSVLLSSRGNTLEDVMSCLWVLLSRIRVVLANTWILLLEVDVDCDWFDVVERVLLIER